MPRTAQEIAHILDGKVVGDGTVSIEGVTATDHPRKNHITFTLEPKHFEGLEDSEIACIVVPYGTYKTKKTLILHPNPKLAFAKLLELFVPPARRVPGISDKAIVARSAKVGPDCTIEPYVVIGENVIIGARGFIRANTTIDRNVVIGEDVTIYPNVTIYHGTQIGSRVIIHAGCVLGADGFGYVDDGEKRVKIPQVGNVLIEDDVELGANVTIDRATMDTTLIRRGTKIDNLTHIAHNCEIGENTILCAQVGIAGTSKVGKNCILAGQVGVSDHCEIGDQVILGAQAGIPPKKKIPPQTNWAGTPARPWEQAIKSHAAMSHLPELVEEVKQLKAQVKKLEEAVELKRLGAKERET